ncbi:hypothetical protein DDZ14_15045 [Maritimibacter sp. 55A14]|nr:hypothetical protein DDZ14_15045 [Maritimibacter sp. 55A14]
MVWILAALAVLAAAALLAARAPREIEASRPDGSGPQFNLAWLDALPGGVETIPAQDCLAEALYFEARGEDILGQIAVAEVIVNRAASPLFPDTVCEVIHQGTGRRHACQFSYTCDGEPEDIREPKAFSRALRLARYLLRSGLPGLTEGAVYYHARSVSPGWTESLPQVAQIGNHVFYGDTESN